MHDGLDALRHAQHVAQVRAVAADEFLLGGKVRDRADIGEPQGVAPGELAAQVAAHVSRRPSDQYLFHPTPGRMIHALDSP